MSKLRTHFSILPLTVGMFAILSVLFAWYSASTYTNAALFFPNPIEVLVYFVHSLSHKIGKYNLTMHTLFSLKRVAVGFGLSSISGIILGVAMGYSKTINAIVRPLFNIIRPIPGLAWIPLAILWFGIGETTKYFIIFMGGFANIVLNSYDGTIKVNPTLEGAARLLGANDVQVFFHVILPSATPYIFAGLQVSLSTSWMAVLAAEMISSYEGAGWIINMGMQTGDTTLILVGMVAIAIVGFLLANIMRIIERSLCSWTIRGR
ncbi:ABC transporter permease [Sphaerochaeta sp.]|uniref:ABC transporter permease n=1 Tax=Sphaerochaeta sp. TaxID=1972642 RepID=UPI002FC62350